MNRKNREGFRKCSCCKNEKELTEANFCKDKNRPGGRSYRCRNCDSSKKDHRRNRYKQLSSIEKDKAKKKNRDYTKQGKGRAVGILSAYRKYDRSKGFVCDLDTDFILTEIFNKPCVYCGDRQKIGCDRIHNSKGHTKDNVVPCCNNCNTTRMNLYSHSEMLLIGEVIRKIKLDRLSEKYL